MACIGSSLTNRSPLGAISAHGQELWQIPNAAHVRAGKTSCWSIPFLPTLLFPGKFPVLGWVLLVSRIPGSLCWEGSWVYQHENVCAETPQGESLLRALLQILSPTCDVSPWVELLQRAGRKHQFLQRGWKGGF